MVPDHSKGLLESDLNIITIAFDPANTLPTTRKLNDSIIEKCEADIKWWEVGQYLIFIILNAGMRIKWLTKLQ